MIETVSIPSSNRDIPHALDYFRASGRARPLVVALRPWSDSSLEAADAYVRQCEERAWHCVFPRIRETSFRADTPDGALCDVQDAYDWAMRNLSVDPRRIFLAGQAAGGYMALVAAGNLPSLWTAVSVWSPAFDLVRWHAECVSQRVPFATTLEAVYGGAPGSSPEVDARFLVWSPSGSLWRAHIIPADINAGIDNDLVSVGHAIRAFNELVKAAGKVKSVISEDVIEHLEVTRRLPEGFERRTIENPSYGQKIYLRRMGALARLTLSEGGGEMIHSAAFAWFDGF